MNFGNCSSSDSILISGSPAPATSVIDTSIFVGTVFTLPWGITVTTAGTYRDTKSTAIGCDSIIVIVNLVTRPKPCLGNDSTLQICNGNSVNLTTVYNTTLLTTNWSMGGTNMLDNYGTLNMSDGIFKINGRLKLNAGSSYNITGGQIILNGNTGNSVTSLTDGQGIFEAAPGMASFSFTGGILQIKNPSLGASSQTINCLYDFGSNTTLLLGDGTSNIASKNTDGFGGLSFPNKIGKLIINAGTKTGNRQFINKKPLNVKGIMEVRTGSGVILQAPITVNK